MWASVVWLLCISNNRCSSSTPIWSCCCSVLGVSPKRDIAKWERRMKTESDKREREREHRRLFIMCRSRCCRDQWAGTVQQKSDDSLNWLSRTFYVKEMVGRYSLSALIKIMAHAHNHPVTHVRKEDDLQCIKYLFWGAAERRVSVKVGFSTPLFETAAPYPVTPCIRSTRHHRHVYYAWPAGKMTGDILLAQQDGHILTA